MTPAPDALRSLRSSSLTPREEKSKTHDEPPSGQLPGELLMWVLILSEIAVFGGGQLSDLPMQVDEGRRQDRDRDLRVLGDLPQEASASVRIRVQSVTASAATGWMSCRNTTASAPKDGCKKQRPPRESYETRFHDACPV